MNEVVFAYLFGSYARGDYIKEFNDFDTKLKIHHKLEVALKKEVDLVVLNSAKNFNLLENILAMKPFC
ncbi:MAG: nucleotidyltransferase domain-containing protein [Epsilonproteobacteria bacterium]|nr:nucleotidyltransferase domain-containing protein [Campylobacterota bacterium]